MVARRGGGLDLLEEQLLLDLLVGLVGEHGGLGHGGQLTGGGVDEHQLFLDTDLAQGHALTVPRPGGGNPDVAGLTPPPGGAGSAAVPTVVAAVAAVVATVLATVARGG